MPKRQSSSMTISDARRVVNGAIPEAEFQRQIIEAAEANGWYVWRDNDSRRNRAGFPDLLLIRGATLLFLEIKTEKGRVHPEQAAVIARLKQVRYVHADVVRPSNWPDLEPVLRSQVR